MSANHVQRRVRAVMKAKGKTQNQLARELGIAGGYLSMILAGKRSPSLSLAVELEKATGVEAKHFVSAEVA